MPFAVTADYETVELLRGRAISDILYRQLGDPDSLIKQWARMVRCQLSAREENR